MMLFLENIRLALSAIKSNRMRSFLTMLGIIIGISSVIAITSIGYSAKAAISKEFEGIGAGYMYVGLNWEMTNEEVYQSDLFDWDEIAAVKERFPDEVMYSAPFYTTGGTAKVAKTTANMRIQGVNAHFADYYKKVQLIHGRMINENDISKRKNNIVIPVEMAERLYGKEDIVGEKITMDNQDKTDSREFLVVGIYNTTHSFLDALDMGEPTYSCYAPYPVIAAYDGEPSSYIEMFVNPDKGVEQTGEKICRWLERIKDKEQGFYRIDSAESNMNQVNEIMNILSLAIGAIAGISLLVGGIGIMNIMLVSVTERTREIGIRKSLGARTKDILTQFLIEAMILSVIGGIIGLLLGIGIAGIGMAMLGASLVVNPMAVVLAVAFSAGVGLFFGIFPAKKAAKLDPIEALRYE